MPLRPIVVMLLLSSLAYAHDDGVSETPPAHTEKKDAEKSDTEAPATKEPAVVKAGEPQTTVSARRPVAAASTQSVKKEDFENVPKRSAASLLEVAPGLVTVQTAGGGKANQYFLRGFDIDHGTDLALSVDGVPVNMPTHAHGQGYSDLNFVIPELVERVEVNKGPYSARYGDFATAGSINLVTSDHVHQNRATFTAGNFGYYRGLLLAAPEPTEKLDGYLGAEVLTNNGPYENGDHLKRYNVMGRAAFRPASGVELSLQVQSMMGGWDMQGAVPLRLIESGRLARFSSLSGSDGGDTMRHTLNLGLRVNDLGGGRLTAGAYGIRYAMNLWSNFTFFASDEVNGDQIKQSDLRTVTGAFAQYQRAFALGPVRIDTTSGLQVRSDFIDVALGRSAARQPLGDLSRSRVAQQTYAAFTEVDVGWTSWLRTVVGARADGFHYDVDDRLGDADGVIDAGLFSPKGALIITPHESISVFGNVGRGFHSNDARALRAPTVATSYEVGARYRPGRALDVGLTGWGMDLDSELVWVGDEGRTEASGASRRRGLELDVTTRPTSWLSATASGTLTDARFVNGDLVPLAPVWTVSAGINVRTPIGIFGAVKWTQVGERPANEDGSIRTKPIALLDASVGYTFKAFTVALDGLNLTNSTWYEGQFVSSAKTRYDGQAVDGLQVMPGYPLTVRGSVTVTLD